MGRASRHVAEMNATGRSLDIVAHPMTPADIPAALALWRACPGVGLGDSDNVEEITAFLARNPGLSWVAWSGDRLVGTVLVGHDGRRGFLYHLAVAPGWRRRGLARLLVDRAVAGLEAAGIRKCHVMVFRTNATGRAFWAAKGWRGRDDIALYSADLPWRGNGLAPGEPGDRGQGCAQ